MFKIKFLSCACFSLLQLILLVVLKLILASKLSELEQFENQEANYQLAATKSECET